MAVSVHSPADLFFDQMNDLRSMTSQLGPHLQDLVTVTKDVGLRALLADYSQSVALHHGAIMELFHRNGREPSNDKCKAIAGLIEGGKMHIAAGAAPGTRDLMVIAHTLRVIGYGNAAYEITSRLAGQMDLTEDAGLLLELQQGSKLLAEELLALQPPIFQAASSPS